MQITDLLAQVGGLQSMARELNVPESQVASGAEALLPAAPVHHGVCVVPNRAIVALEDGSVVCLGQ